MPVPFIPTVYEHGAALTGKTPSQVAQDAKLLIAAQQEAYARYRHPLVSVGVDIYNVEAEALGASVRYFSDETLPALSGPIIHEKEDFYALSCPDPERDGRMPLLLEACSELKKTLPVPVSGTVVGPFTLAALLRGFEEFTMDLLEDPDFANEQLQFAKEVGLRFAAAYQKRGVGIALNESWIAPPLCAPSLYRAFAKPVETAQITALREMGFSKPALICGGDTTSIASDMLETGAGLLMVDWCCDRRFYQSLCRKTGATLRASIPSELVEEGDRDAIRHAVERVVSECGDYPGFVLGCGIVSYKTPPEHVLYVKELAESM